MSQPDPALLQAAQIEAAKFWKAWELSDDLNDNVYHDLVNCARRLRGRPAGGDMEKTNG